MRSPLILVCTLLLLLLALAAPAAAQEPHPLAALIAVLPTADEALLALAEEIGVPRSPIEYVDLAVLRAAYDPTDFFASDSPLTPYAALLVPLINAEVVGMAQAVGFSFDDIERVLAYGLHPPRLMLLQGEFDGEAVRAAFAASGFAVTTDLGYTSICNPDGCEESTAIDIRGRNQGNPFGGNIGRREAIALVESETPGGDLLLATPYYPLLEATIARITGGTDDRVSQAALRAADFVIAEAGEAALAAANLYPAGFLVRDEGAGAALPAWDMLALASYAAPDAEPRALAALIYADGAAVAELGEQWGERLAEASAIDEGGASIADLFQRQNVLIDSFGYAALPEGWGALALRFTAQRPYDRAFRLLIRMLERRDAAWLAP